MKSKKISHSKAKPKAGPKTSSNFEKFYKNSDKKEAFSPNLERNPVKKRVLKNSDTTIESASVKGVKPSKELKRKLPSVNNYTNTSSEDFRLNKYIAHCGLCSRREAAAWVKAGKIQVNGKLMDNPSYIVQKTDKIVYEGKAIKPEVHKVYVLMNKPKNVVTTLSDEKERRTVLDLLGDRVAERVYPVGRLDRNSTGLLLLTNDGDLAQKLSHPSHQIKKIYHVGLNKNLTKNDFEKITLGIKLEDGFIKVDSMDYVEGKKDEVGIEIHSGKNRIIRRIFEQLDYEVKKLDRVYYGGLTKKNLPRGKFRFLLAQEVIMLKHFT
jgi:23S rRNA pseudouridine2605 synthase